MEVVPTLGREISPADDVVSLARMVQLLRRTRPDVVHTHMAKAGTIGRLAAMVCRVPLIVHTYHGHVFHSYFSPRKTRVFVQIERALARGTSKIIVVGDRQRDEIASFGVAPRDKLVPIRLGLELQPFLRAEDRRGELRAELGIDAHVPLIGVVARLVPIKAHAMFLQASAIVRQREPMAMFLVVGDGERRAELEALVARLQLTDAVRFLGWRNDMPRVYADLDVVALSSLNEGSPVSLIEALAAARPVVATAVGGVPEVVLDGQTGLTVPPSDPRAMAQAIVRLLEDRRMADELANAGRRHVYPRYDSSRLVDDMRVLYLRELGARGRQVRTDVGAAIG
jgi:glycosyltransferase involved in cell wall biosynthesis